MLIAESKKWVNGCYKIVIEIFHNKIEKKSAMKLLNTIHRIDYY